MELSFADASAGTFERRPNVSEERQSVRVQWGPRLRRRVPPRCASRGHPPTPPRRPPRRHAPRADPCEAPRGATSRWRIAWETTATRGPAGACARHTCRERGDRTSRGRGARERGARGASRRCTQPTGRTREALTTAPRSRTSRAARRWRTSSRGLRRRWGADRGLTRGPDRTPRPWRAGTPPAPSPNASAPRVGGEGRVSRRRVAGSCMYVLASSRGAGTVASSGRADAPANPPRRGARGRAPHPPPMSSPSLTKNARSPTHLRGVPVGS